MKLNASEFSLLTKALLIGTNYEDTNEFDTLRSPEQDAKRLYDALTHVEANAIPSDNVTLLTGEDATQVNIYTELNHIGASITSDEYLIIYFAGHGFASDQDFYLASIDSKEDRLEETAIRGSILDEIIGSVRCRGVFIVLDCCQGAGFAENAPSVFREIGESEFRILLSASKADEPSWELPEINGTVFSRHLIDSIAGEHFSTSTPGLIYFTELLKNIQNKVREDLNSIYQNQPNQEPVFAGVFVKDPLLFVNKKLTLREIDIKTTRYPREYVRKILRKSIIAFAALILFITGTLYVVLSKYEYVIAEQEVLSVYQGYPDINLFRFPKKKWSFSLSAENALDNSPLRISKPLISDLDEPIIPYLTTNLKPEYQALMFQWQGNDSLARNIILALVADEDRPIDDKIGPMIILSGLAIPQDTMLLHEIITNSTIEDVKENAFRRLVKLAPSHAVELILGNQNLNTREHHTIILNNLKSGYQFDYSAYFEFVLSSEISYSSHPSLVPETIEAAMRTDHKLSSKSLMLALKESGYSKDIEDITYYSLLNEVSGFEEELLAYLNEIASYDYPLDHVGAFDLSDIMSYFYLVPNQNCEKEFPNLLDAKYDFFLTDIVRTVSRACPELRPQIQVWLKELPPEERNSIVREMISELVSYEIISTDEIRDFYETAIDHTNPYEVAAFLDQLSIIKHKPFIGVARELLKSNDSNIKKSAIDFLNHMEDTVSLDNQLFLDNQVNVQIAAYQYQLRTNPTLAMEHLLSRLEDTYLLEYLDQLLIQTEMSDSHFRKASIHLNGSVTEKKNASIIIALQGSKEEVLELLKSPDPQVREVVTNYLPANENFLQVVMELERGPFPNYNYDILDYQFKQQNEIKAVMESLDQEYQSWYIDLVFRTQKLEHGMKLWARLLGSTTDSQGTGLVSTGRLKVSN